MKLCKVCSLPLRQEDMAYERHAYRDCIDYIDTKIQELTQLRIQVVANLLHGSRLLIKGEGNEENQV